MYLYFKCLFCGEYLENTTEPDGTFMTMTKEPVAMFKYHECDWGSLYYFGGNYFFSIIMKVKDHEEFRAFARITGILQQIIIDGDWVYI